MDIRDNYKPNPWQEKYHSSNNRHFCLVGGYGCTVANQKIVTKDGLVEIANITSPTALLSLSHKNLAWSQCTSSFPVGKKRLIRIVHEFGELLVSESHKIFCADGVYRQASQLDSSIHSLLGVDEKEASSCQHETTSGIFQLKYGADDPRLMQILANYLDDCLTLSHQYGRLPRQVLEACQFLSPQLFDEIKSFHLDEKENSLVLELIHTHHGQVQDLLEKNDFSSLMGALSLDEEDQVLSTSSEHISVDNLQPEKFLGSYEYHLKELLSSSNHILTSKNLYRPSKILSIESKGIEWVFDLHVLGTNNYVSGGAINSNSGKSTAAVKEHIQLAMEYPGSLWLIGRKTLPSLKDTILRTFMNAIDEHLISDFNKAHLNCKLINGSEFLFRPLDDPEKLKSLEIAGFIIEEATEVERDIYDRLKDRMRQKIAGVSPRYRSTIMLNPCEEDHWIPQLFLHNRPHLHELITSSTHENMANLPEDYLDELKRTYSEDMLQRVIYGQFSKVHTGKPVFPQFMKGPYVASIEFNRKLPMIRAWDFGFNRPACVWLQIESDQVRVLGEKLGKEIYLDDFIMDCRSYEEELFGTKIVFRDYCDPRGSDESDKGKTSVQILREHRIYPGFRRTSIEEGIKAIKNKLDTKDKKTGHPNFLIHPRCRILIEALKGGYARTDREESPKKDGYYEHCLSRGTKITTSNGIKNIEDIVAGDDILSSEGLVTLEQDAIYKGVENCFKLEFSDGKKVICTAEHKFWTNKGWVKANALSDSHLIATDGLWQNQRLSKSTALNFAGIPITKTLLSEIILDLTQIGFIKALRAYIDICGRKIMEKFQMDIQSITKTVIPTIMTSQTLSSLEQATMSGFTQMNVSVNVLRTREDISEQLESSLRNGTPHPRVWIGTGSTLQTLKKKIGRKWRVFAPFVENLIKPMNSGLNLVMQNIAIKIVGQQRSEGAVKLLSRVPFGTKEVYDVNVPYVHNFYANGILVHNCMDALRYAVIHSAMAAKVAAFNEGMSSVRVHVDPRTARRIEF